VILADNVQYSTRNDLAACRGASALYRFLAERIDRGEKKRQLRNAQGWKKEERVETSPHSNF